MTLLPKNYDKAIVDDYLKFQEGENKIRVLAKPIAGYLYWTYPDSDKVVPRGDMGGKGSMPHRVPDFAELEPAQRNGMKAFMAMVVWNYNLNAVQIMEITQKSIMGGLEALDSSKAWGSVLNYDINIIKTKTGARDMDVEYSVLPDPKAKLNKEIEEEYKAMPIRLEALWTNDDPFDVETDEDTKPEKEDLTEEELEEVIEDLDGKAQV